MDSPTKPRPGRSLARFSRMSHIWDLSFDVAWDTDSGMEEMVWSHIIKILTSDKERTQTGGYIIPYEICHIYLLLYFYLLNIT